jgi:translation initiation factor IF-3
MDENACAAGSGLASFPFPGAIRRPESTKGEVFIARRPMQAPPTKEGPRINDMIVEPTVLLIDAEGEKRGVIPTDEAIRMAEEAGLDLVEVSPNAKPPVCKLLDYGKYKYQAQKKANEARKKQKTVEVKEIKMRPNIDTHDYEVKMRSMLRFFEEGDKVKVTLRFRGREMAHQELGMQLLNKVKEEVDEIAKVETYPRLEGRQMVMVLAPR